jgi:hypothetical protein
MWRLLLLVIVNAVANFITVVNNMGVGGYTIIITAIVFVIIR